MNIFSGLITSKTRIRILMRLFLNPSRHAYLRELADEFQLSPSQVSEELKQLKKADLLTDRKEGRHILYSANQSHPLFPELQSMVGKALGMDRILESILTRLGNLEKAYLIDDYAEGKDSGLIDLLLVGNIDEPNLNDLTRKTELCIERKIRILILTSEEYENFAPTLASRPRMLLWEQGEKNLRST